MNYTAKMFVWGLLSLLAILLPFVVTIVSFCLSVYFLYNQLWWEGLFAVVLFWYCCCYILFIMPAEE